MAAVASLFNVPANQQELNMWAFAHAAHHLDINTRIAVLGGTPIQSFVLDPINIHDMQNWLYQHQYMHQQMDAQLGISGYNLVDVDWRDQDQFAGWIDSNANEHYQIANLLNIG
jgi:hypothetical protein